MRGRRVGRRGGFRTPWTTQLATLRLGRAIAGVAARTTAGTRTLTGVPRRHGTGPFPMAKSRQELASLSKDALVDMLLAKQEEEGLAASAIDGPRPNKRQRKQDRDQRPFDMSRHPQRHIALRVAYIGTDFQGFAYQATAPAATVEGQVLMALTKTCLITDRASCGIVVGGRTDSGVSGLGQVVSLRVRCNATVGEGVMPPEAPPAAAAPAAQRNADSPAAATDKEELDYCKMLNGVLPKDIRILGWHPVTADFSARFSASQRTYKYFFPRGTLDVGAMRAGAQRLLGEHDLRNFCKIDPTVTNFVRQILRFDVEPCTTFAGGLPADHPQSIWAFTISGTAFLYHQVRCMVAVLFLVGEGKEAPGIVSELLDLRRYPRRPNYDMASEAQLLLYRIDYGDKLPAWRANPRTDLGNLEVWGEMQRACMLRGALLHTMRAAVLDASGEADGGHAGVDDTAEAVAVREGYGTMPPGGTERRGRTHIPLAQRPTSESVEVRTKGKAK